MWPPRLLTYYPLTLNAKWLVRLLITICGLALFNLSRRGARSALRHSTEECPNLRHKLVPSSRHSIYLRRASPAFCRGQVLVLVTLAIVMLIGCVALAVDVGFLWGAKRRMQTAADAGAAAGAIASREGYGVTTAAKDATALNGFTDGTSNVNVTVTNPYSGGSCSANCVQVTVEQEQPTYFLRVLGFSQIDVQASAVAGTLNSGSCIYSLSKTASPGLKVDGSTTVSIPSCDVVVNSDGSPGATCGGSASFTAGGIAVAGSVSGTCLSPTPSTGAGQTADPFSYLGTQPSCSGNTSQNITNGNTVTLTQGSFCGGITIHSGATVTFSAGTYNLGSGGLSISGGTIHGTGVTFISTGTISVTGGTINLSAPTSSTYKGILFWDTTTANTTIAGGSGSTFDGAIYVPNSLLKYAGNSSGSGYTIIAAGSVEFTGTSTVGDNYSSLSGGTSPVESTVLYQ